MNRSTARTGLRIVFAINAVAAAAAAVVLAVAPAAIPAAVGITITPDADLLAYLLAAAEIALASMCAFALWSAERGVELQTVAVLVVFHGASALAGFVVARAGAAPVLWNVLTRVVMVCALVLFARGAHRQNGNRSH